MTKLRAKTRDGKEKPKHIRRAGGVPAVLYGHKVKNISLTLDGKSFSKLYKSAGETTLLDLHVDGEHGARSVLVHDVSLDPVQESILHVDLYEVRKDEKIKTHIPLVFEGESDAVKSQGGVLMKHLYKLEVEALPKDLPHDVKVDISSLKTFNDTVTVGDLQIPHGVKIHADAKEIIAKVLPPRTEAELEALKEEVVMKVEEVKVETEEKKKEREAAKAAEKEGEKEPGKTAEKKAEKK